VDPVRVPLQGPLSWEPFVQDEFRVARNDVILKFADEFVSVTAIKMLGAAVERRHKQEDVSAAGKVFVGKAQKLRSDAMPAR
jgi:hypothetical protein